MVSLIKALSASEKETLEIASRFGSALPANSVVCFFGGLGAGKTTFVKGLAAGAAGVAMEQVSSPTFAYLNIYEGTLPIYHFDLYRLRDSDEFLSMGFEDFFYLGGICCIEWSEKIREILPDEAIRVEIGCLGEERRSIEVTAAHG